MPRAFTTRNRVLSTSVILSFAAFTAATAFARTPDGHAIGPLGHTITEFQDLAQKTKPPYCPTPPPKQTQSERVVAYNRKLVRSCQKSFPVGKEKRVSFEHLEPCNSDGNSPTLHGALTNYVLKSAQDGIHLGMRIVLWPQDGTPAEWNQVLEAARGCSDRIAAVWGRYGITFEPKFTLQKKGDVSIPGNDLKFYVGKGRSEFSTRNKRGTLYFSGRLQDHPRSRNEKRDIFCKMLIHELGHGLSLPDEYPDGDCPNREYVARFSERHPWSIMNDSFFPWHEIEFFPRHLAQILGHACNVNSEAISYETQLTKTQ